MTLVRTATLDVAVDLHGPEDGTPVVLLHGFPYAPCAYDAMVAPLVEDGMRVIVPALRGYGATRFLSEATLRSGQQAALGQDLLDLLDALRIEQAALVGYDWGGRAACIVAAIWPGRVRALVTGDGYNIQDIAGSVVPQTAEIEHRLWYQYYLHTQRGRDGLAADRAGFARLLWRQWSPGWAFDDAIFAQSAEAFDNPDFVDVVVHSYRHRFGYVAGDPAVEPIEQVLAHRPGIAVPTIALCGADDGVSRVTEADPQAHRFTGRYERRVLAGVGHNIPQEAPRETVAALRALLADERNMASGGITGP
jgi:pimeloyl-ACP methyl ester carboxylesterase